MNIVEINNLVKRYGRLIALDHFNLAVEKGEIYGLLGPNGSGKTTAINCLLSLLKYDKGDIKIFGEEMSPTKYGVKERIGVVGQNVAVIEELNAYDNIDYFCSLYVKDKKKRRELVEQALEFVGLNEFRKMLPKKMSGGLLRRLNIACGIAHKPELIIFDEPTVAVDPQSRNKILEGIQELNRQGATIIYTSHYMEEIEQLCTKITIMDHGRAVVTGSKEELKGMINCKEIVTFVLPMAKDTLLNELKALKGCYNLSVDGDNITLNFSTDDSNLINVINTLKKHGAAFGSIHSQQATLNDVFLEITGKELRDQ